MRASSLPSASSSDQATTYHALFRYVPLTICFLLLRSSTISAGACISPSPSCSCPDSEVRKTSRRPLSELRVRGTSRIIRPDVQVGQGSALTIECAVKPLAHLFLPTADDP